MDKVFLDYKKIIPGLLVLLLCGNAFSQDASTGVTWERPDTDLSKYSRVLVKPLDIGDVKVFKPVWEQDDPDDWEFVPGTGEAIQSMFMDTISDELSKDESYPVVPGEGEGVLQLEVEFLSITPYIKPGSGGEDEGHVISTLGSGDVVVSAELRDSVTGSLLILVEGERQIGSEYKELSRGEPYRQSQADLHHLGSTVACPDGCRPRQVVGKSFSI